MVTLKKVRKHKQSDSTSALLNLLPQQIAQERKGRETRRLLILIAGGVVCLGVVAFVASLVLAFVAQSDNDAVHSETRALAQKQAKLQSIQEMKDSVSQTKAALQTAGAQDVDWATTLGKIDAILPPGVTYSSLNVESSTSVATVQQAANPLEGSRIAILTYTMEAPNPELFAQTLTALQGVDGYVDAVASQVTVLDAQKSSAIVVLHLGEKILSSRFTEANN